MPKVEPKGSDTLIIYHLTGYPHMYKQDSPSALDAITETQRIVFAPVLFQTALCLRDTGVLIQLDEQSKRGTTLDEITENSTINEYAASILLDMGLNGRVITYKEGYYYLTKVGHFLLRDTMARVNMDFTQDVCYQGLFYLEDVLEDGKPVGLKIFGDWPAVCPALSQLPPVARESWFTFGHYCSDGAFDAALPYVLASAPTTLYDVDGNTGKWALRYCQHDDSITVALLGLPQQITLARESIGNAGLSHRIDFHAVGMLNDSPLPGGTDTQQMSQFLGCFSPEQITAMLSNVARVMRPGTRLCIMELFWDAQKFEATSSSLNASLLYFTCMVSDNSRFCSVERLYHYLNQAGFRIDERHGNLDVGHTSLICQKKKQETIGTAGLPRIRVDKIYFQYYRLASQGAWVK